MSKYLSLYFIVPFYALLDSNVALTALRARFWSKYIKTTLIQVYTSTNNANEDGKDVLYEICKRSMTKHHVMIQFSRSKFEGEDILVGRHRVQSERNDNGEKFVSFCGINNLA